MSPEEWLQLSPLLDELLELSPEQREQRLASITREHPDQAEELRRLLALEEATPDFMARPILEDVATTAHEGDLIGPYRLEQMVGEGGMGQVWQASRADGLYERRVALKLLRAGYADPNLRSRFHRERQILARLGHANIARLLDAGTSDDGRPYLAIEFINGEAITDYAKRLGLDAVERLRLFVQVCGAVSHAHANLVVHRDLKPSNILVTPAGDVRLLDFGIAKLLDTPRHDQTQITRAESRPFTLHYAAPEQIRGEPITTMTDVYALGVVLYELLTDQRPYVLKRDSDAGWEEAILEAEPVRPSLAVARDTARTSARRKLARRLSGDLDNIILKALRKSPQQRYPSAEALCHDLVRHLEGRPVGARAQSFTYRLGKFASRHAVALGTAAMTVTLLGLGLGAVHWQAQHAVQEARRAQAMQNFVVALFETSGRDSGGGNVDLRRLLDEGMRRANHELAAQPESRAELLGLIARLHNGLGNHEQALVVLEEQQASIDAVGGRVSPALVLSSAAQRGRALRLYGQPRECTARLGEVLDTHGAMPSREWPLLADVHTQLGRCHEALAQQPEATAHFQQALGMRSGRPLDEADSLVDVARMEARAGRPAAAMQRLDEAMQLLRRGGGDRSAQSTDLWRQMAAVQLQQGQLARAEGDGRQALEDALLNFGALHPATLSVQRQLAEVALELGDLGHARRLGELSLRELGARYGERQRDAAETRLLLTAVSIGEGRLAEAADHLQRARAALAGDAGTLLRPRAQLLQGRLLFERGEIRRAHMVIDAAMGEIEAVYGPRHPMRLEARLLRGQVLAGMGDLNEAGQELAGALEVLDVGQDGLPVVARVRLAQVRLAAERGDFSEARSTLEALLVANPASDPARSLVHMQARVLEAELYCGQGDVSNGQAALATLTDVVQAMEQANRSGWHQVINRARQRCEHLADGQGFVAAR